ncbi:MAG: RagB/SusD family nutrient uptake outer membrane protein [Paludibacteraceae bacterium]|nr:RagB/SusD family nutrient uptake outer membrane protein [Paludibacteraceae bacterium]
MLFPALFSSCDNYLTVEPQGVISEELAMDEPDKMVTAAYAKLGDDWYTYPFNMWPYGDVTSDDAMKGGSGTTDTNYHPFEVWSSLTASSPDHMDEMWYHLYCSVSRCNRALVSLADHGDKMDAETRKIREAEVRFLRAHFYFKLVQIWNQVPWIDEEVYRVHSEEQTRNDAFTHEELMQKIVDDFKFAYDNLPEAQAEGGRANKIAAAAYLAKCYLTMAWGNGYEAETGVDHINTSYMQSVITYTDVVANSSYGYLEDFGDIFLPENKNSKESIFAVQHSNYEEDNTLYGRANWSNMLNGCWQMWSCGWDFHKPTQNLVNAFKTEGGLPMFDTYNDVTAYPINGAPTAQKWDPRLFHTVGMPTFPYKYEAEYTMTKDNSRTPNTYGYYASLKEVPQRSKGEHYDNPWQAFGMNDYVLRYTDVMLMRAEAMIETGNLEGARGIINDIRQRAKNSVSKHIGYAADQCEINLYPASDFDSKEKARLRLQWERRLEMAMENGRFFDLRRWGIASETLNKFFEVEKNSVYEGQTYAQYYGDAHFTTGKNEYFPIPYIQLFYVPGLYTQNKGY